MRQAYRLQSTLPLAQVPHKHAVLLARIAEVLDSRPQLEAQILADLVRPGTRADFGRDGMSAQQVLRVRVRVLYLMLKTDFAQLEFDLADSPTYRAFCLLGLGDAPPKRSTLQEKCQPRACRNAEVFARAVRRACIAKGARAGHQVRTDTTPVSAKLRAPYDSTFRGDAVRLLERLLRRAQKQVPMQIPNHRRRVRRRTTALRNDKLDKEHRAALYFDLLQEISATFHKFT